MFQFKLSGKVGQKGQKGHFYTHTSNCQISLCGQIAFLTFLSIRRKLSLLSLLSHLRPLFNLTALFSKGKIFLGVDFLEGQKLGTEKEICHNLVNALARVLRSVHTLKVSARSITVAGRRRQHINACIRQGGGATVPFILKNTGSVCTVGRKVLLSLLPWLTTSDHTWVTTLCSGIQRAIKPYVRRVMTSSPLVRHKSGSVHRSRSVEESTDHNVKCKVSTSSSYLPLKALPVLCSVSVLMRVTKFNSLFTYGCSDFCI